MTQKRTLPSSASVANEVGDGKLFAPSAARNVQAITNLLVEIAPPNGHALELASGTGQHIIAFAQALPQLRWHPSEIDAARRASISAHIAQAALNNVSAPVTLDATSAGWANKHPNTDLILLSNLLHLISAREAKTIISEAAKALTPQGVFLTYGPFKRDGHLTSDGDVQFDRSLREQDADIGYKDAGDVQTWGEKAGLTHLRTVDMPANNLAILWQNSGPQLI